jgi:hypothetical protein
VTYTNTTGIFTNVATYSVTVKNAAGCISAPTSVTIIANQQQHLLHQLRLALRLQRAVATGTITFVTARLELESRIALMVRLIPTTGIFTNVAAATYSVTVKMLQDVSLLVV